MAEIETVLVGDFSHLETPTNNRRHGSKAMNTSSSASTFVETPMANGDSPHTLCVRAMSSEGKKKSENIMKDLETPPRQNNRKTFLSRMAEQFPSPEDPRGILSPSMSEVTAPSAFKERNRSFVSPNVSAIDLSISRASIKPNLLFREKETKKAKDLSTILRSRSEPVRGRAPALLPVTPEAEDKKQPMVGAVRKLSDTPESQPGRIVPTSHIRDDESWCASSVCPFDCVEDDNKNPLSETLDEPKEKKKMGFFGLFKKGSISKQRSIPDSGAEPQKLVDLEEGDSVDIEFIESINKGCVSNEFPIDESGVKQTGSRDTDNREEAGSADNLEDMKSGGMKDIPDLDETVAPSRSYDDDEENSPERVAQRRAEQTRRCAKRILFYVFVPALVLSIIILTSVLVKRMTGRETALAITTQTGAPTDEIDVGLGQTQRPIINVPDFFDNTHPSCGTSQQLSTTSLSYDSMSDVKWDETINACGDSLEFGFATWYSVEVDESTFMEASTCNAADFDTQITVMSGDCGGLSCVTFSDNECGGQSWATWYAEKGKSYFVVVSGYREEWGEYTLSLNPTTINDKCDDSVSQMTMGSTVFGTTSGATTEDLPSCSGVDATKPGVWYEVSNVDGPIIADVTGRGFNFAGQVSIYDGSCDVLSCAAGSKSGSVTWDAARDSTYHVYVNGVAVEGDFDLYLGRDNKESCNDASSLQPSNFAYTSSTRDARQQDVKSCGFDGRQHTAPGKWFSLMGTGNEFRVSTCSMGTDLDTEISLFKGSCGALECVAGTGNALPCGEGGALSWKTAPGSMYYIYVSGRGSRVGDFWLTLEETELVGAQCTEPLALGSFSTTEIEGSTGDGSAETVWLQGPVWSARGVWYELIGTGNLVELSVCGIKSDFDVRVSVSTGGCSDQTYLGQSAQCGEDGETIKFVSTIGHKYQVFVHGSNEVSTGEYTLRLKHFDELNDRCELALPLETVSGEYSGSTTDTIINNAIDAKNSFTPAPTVSMTSPPTRGITSPPTRAPTRRPTALPTSIPSASPTETPKKGGNKPDNKGGKDKESNNKNARRVQAIVDSCNFIPPTHGLWYQIDGSGGDIIVSTCSEETNFDTVIDVFAGGCGELQCIASNDDGCGSQSLVRFASKIGVSYFIQVRGVNESEVGDFSLSITVRNPNFGI